MGKLKIVNRAGILAVAAAMVLGFSLETPAQTSNGYIKSDSVNHANKYGKLRSTTHEQRMAAAKRKAAMMDRVKTQREASGITPNDTTTRNGGKPPATHKINRPK